METLGIRRGLDSQKYLLEFVTYGFEDWEGSNVPVPKTWRNQRAVKGADESWPVETLRQSALKRLRGLAGIGDHDKMGLDRASPDDALEQSGEM